MSSQRIVLNRDWRFIREDVAGGEAPSLDDSQWQRVHLPHTFDLPYFRTPEFYVGYGWYRKRLVVSEQDAGRCVQLEFDGVFQDAEIFINGQLAGRHIGGYTGFAVDLTPHVRVGENLIAIRVNNNWNPQIAPRAGEHIFSGGIYRDVYLRFHDRLHLAWNGTHWSTPKVSAHLAVVETTTSISNRRDAHASFVLRHQIVDGDGKVVANTQSDHQLAPYKQADFAARLPEIQNPKLWHPDHPTLYTLRTTLFEAGKAIDESSVPIAFRWFEWTKDRGFFLNGQHLYLRGANLHQDQSGWGIAVAQAATRRDVQLMKDAGFNFIRGAHYPHHPAFSQACDELGMLLWCELPFWGKGGFGPEGYWNSSAYPADEKDFAGFEASCELTLREMIQIHRNHPSIVAWSMTNEAFFTYNIEQAKPLIKKLVNLTHELDPSRPAAVGGAQRGGFDQLGDLAGYNGDGAKLYVDPGVPNMVSEYGAISKPPTSYEPFFGDLQREQFPWRAGEAIWCGADYGTIAGKQGLKGIVDHARLPKRSWYWYRNAYRGIPEIARSSESSPTALRLEASSNVIHGTDGLEDSQIIVTACDDQGLPVDTTLPITLTIVSGPGEFPTGRSITFDPSTDITYHLGAAAIAFRSYHGGETVIRASAPGLNDAFLTVTTLGNPPFTQQDIDSYPDRPYTPPAESEAAKLAIRRAVNVARDRPCRASSEDPLHPARLANDAESATFWRADTQDPAPFWQVDLEGFYQLSSLRIRFTHAGNYRFILTTSIDGVDWETPIDRSQSVNTAQQRDDVFPFASAARYVRLTCTNNPVREPFAICELELFGVPSVR